jgi:hypothetical protein
MFKSADRVKVEQTEESIQFYDAGNGGAEWKSMTSPVRGWVKLRCDA